MKNDLVFLDAYGNPINNDKPPRLIWNYTLKKLGIRHRVSYQTRSTSITMNLMAGANPYWIAEQHGHNLQTMLKKYARWLKNKESSEKNKLDNKLLNIPKISPKKSNKDIFML